MNWTLKLDAGFYESQAIEFLADPAKYLAGETNNAQLVGDIYLAPVHARRILAIAGKVVAHWLFAGAGKLSIFRKCANHTVLRKCFVDDVERTFDASQSNVLRLVFPFPLGIRRQLRYIFWLTRKNYPYSFLGHRYLPKDLIRLIIKRDVRSLMRLETRAQLRLAQQLLALRPQSVQLSDESDIGSLAFSRLLFRNGIPVVNSAHGAGIYFPYHCYSHFYTLTQKQQKYYKSIKPCEYSTRQLNYSFKQSALSSVTKKSNSKLNLILLNQAVYGLDDEMLIQAEEGLIEALRHAFDKNCHVSLKYKPHPNNKRVKVPLAFQLAEITDHNENPIYVSFFSTSQIDPTFIGKKYLVRTQYIRPEILFDCGVPIVTVDELICIVRAMAEKQGKTHEARETRSAITL